jgi:PKD repeat protein
VVLLLLASIGAGSASRELPGSSANPLARQGVPLDTPVLTLVPTPESGSAPLSVNVSATVSAGVAPYTLSVCFGTQQHSSPPTHCNGTVSNWSGNDPLLFAHRYATPGNYSVTGILTDARGAGVGSTILIVVTNGTALTAQAAESGSVGTAPYAVEFTASVSGETPPITIQWNFGDGTSGSSLPGSNVTHVYAAAGAFAPSLTVTDGSGHRTVKLLPSVTVTAAPGGLSGLTGPFGGLSLLLAGALFLVAAAIAVVVVRTALRRRWRREGNDLVDRLRVPPRAPSHPRAP